MIFLDRISLPSWPSLLPSKDRISQVCRQIFMLVQYAVVAASIFLRHFYWIPSTIRFKDRNVFSFNLASLETLPKCLHTVSQPIPKAHFQGVERNYNLRITHAVTYPATGCCLGMSLAFLSDYLHQSKTLLEAAQKLRWGANETSVKTQALYNTLLGSKGTFKESERQAFFKILRKDKVASIQNLDLLVSAQSFLQQSTISSLRQYILDDLENKNIEITPDLYILILELDAEWRGCNDRYEVLHYDVMRAAADSLGLKLNANLSLSGRIGDVANRLIGLETGNYLVHFRNHTVVYIKTASEMGVWDPNEGLALFNQDRQNNILSHLLNHYAEHEQIRIKINPTFAYSESFYMK